MADKFIMISLEENKAKKLAEVISNDTARKILDYLSDKEEATTSEISTSLKIPISTVNYNIKNLMENKLIESKEFKWSQKGREMDIYKLANKYIIISPKKSAILKNKLKEVFIIISIGAVITFFINYISIQKAKISPMISQASNAASAITKSYEVSQTTIISNTAIWFFIGVIFAVIIHTIISWRRT